MAEDTTLTTGIAALIKLSSCPKIESKKPGKILNRAAIIIANKMLMRTIRFINNGTSSFLPCPIILLTMDELVAASAHVTHPLRPKTLRITYEMARAC